MEDLALIEELDFLEKTETKRERRCAARPDYLKELDDEEFRKRFRLTKESVLEITRYIKECLECSSLNNALTPVEQVLIALRFYAVGCMQLAIGDLFAVSQPTVSRVVHRVSEAIAALLPNMITMPASREECTEVSSKFFTIAGFPNVIGALDGTFVRIKSPGGDDAERFRCRKGFFAINVQTIVDADLVIRNVVARWPGSAHDSTIFNSSAACLSLKSNPLYKDYHLLGDSGYGCEKHLMTPFGNPRNVSEVRFNKSHVLTRNTVERKYGVLKRRFPCLMVGLSCHVDRVPAIITSCCVLHNLALRLGDPEPPADPQITALLRQIEMLESQLSLSPPSIAIQPRGPAGFVKRSLIASKYFSY